MKRLFGFAVVVALLATLVPQTRGAIDVGTDLTFTRFDVSYTTTGGPFRAHIPSTSASTDIAVYCVQLDEHISLGGTYNVKAFSSATQTTPPVPTPPVYNYAMTGYAAWVYDKFLDEIDLISGDLATKVTSLGATRLGEYQKAIWAGMVRWTDTNGNFEWDGRWEGGVQDTLGGVESLLGGVNSGNSEYPGALASGTGFTYTDFLTTANRLAWGGSESADDDRMLRTHNGFKVMVMETLGGGGAQDMVIYKPGSLSADVPEPGSIAVWSVLGGAAAAFAARRRRSAKRGRWSDENRQAILSVIDAKARR